MVQTVSNQVGWSHFLSFWEKLQVLEAIESEFGNMVHKMGPAASKTIISMILVRIGPNSLESGGLVPLFLIQATHSLPLEGNKGNHPKFKIYQCSAILIK